MTDTPTAEPTVSVGLPAGLAPEKVRARKAALIAAGTEPLLAEKLAIDACEQQAARDALNEAAEKPVKKEAKK